MAQVIGYSLAAVWYGIGLMGSHTFVQKGYMLNLGAYLWGAMFGPVQLILAMIAPHR